MSSNCFPDVALASPLAEDVLIGLGSRQKSLPSWLFYDEQGSQLFEEITRLPEYYLTRIERGIFETHAEGILARASDSYGHRMPLTLLELGSGSAEKTGLLIEAALCQQPELLYCPIDVSESALEESARRLEWRYGSNLRVQPKRCEFTRELGRLPASAGSRRLVLWIGSSIGNFTCSEASAMLAKLRERLSPDDCLLLGVDLVPGSTPQSTKDEGVLLAAYNDAAGVTAEFNLNVLNRLNRELGANFDVDSFEHQARWNPVVERIEMHLVSLRPQRVRVAALGRSFSFAEGESIHTENCHKYSLPGVESILADCEFRAEKHWLDPEGWFAVMLARAI